MSTSKRYVVRICQGAFMGEAIDPKYAVVDKDFLEVKGWVSDKDEATLLRAEEAAAIIEEYSEESPWEFTMVRMRRPKYRSIDEV